MTLDEVSDHLPDTTSQPLELRIADETDAMRILEYLHDIEEPYKEVFMLRVFGELSFKKIWDEVAIRKAFIVKSYGKKEIHIPEKKCNEARCRMEFNV